MASGPAVLKELSALGLDYAFIAGVAKHLRPAGLVKTSRKGGGIGTAHWDETDLTRIILSLAGGQPSDASAAVAALHSLPHAGSFSQLRNSGIRTPEGDALNITFGAYLEGSMQIVSRMNPQEIIEEQESCRHDTITMTLDPPRAEVTSYTYNSTLVTVYEASPPLPVEGQNALLNLRYQHPTTPLWRRQTTVLPYQILIAAGRLVASKPTNAAALPFPGEAPSGANPRNTNENAPDPARSEARVRDSQPRKQKLTETSDTSEFREDGKPHQALSASRGWSSLILSGDQPPNDSHP
jgi:hypothetical protein